MGLKWPNDIIVEGLGKKHPNQWNKLGGILCEVAPGGIVAGVGVNLRDEGLPSARELRAEGEPGIPGPGAHPETQQLGGPLAVISLQRVLRHLAPDDSEPTVEPPALARAVIFALRQWADPPPSRLDGHLREAWESLDLLRGREVEVRSGPRGRVNGVAKDGALLVGTHAIRAGSVRCVDVGRKTPQPTTKEQESE